MMKLKILTLAMVLAMPAIAAEEFSLTDMIPARPGAQVANAGIKPKCRAM